MACFCEDKYCYYNFFALIFDRIDILRTRSLQCFHDLIGSLNIEDFGSHEELFAAWAALLQQISEPVQKKQQGWCLYELKSSWLHVCDKCVYGSQCFISGSGN